MAGRAPPAVRTGLERAPTPTGTPAETLAGCRQPDAPPACTHAPPGSAQVKQLVTRAYRRAKDLMVTNIDVLHKVAAVLMERENIDGDEFASIVAASQAEQYLKEDAPGVSIPYQAA